MGIIWGGLIESINLEQNPHFPGRQHIVCGWWIEMIPWGGCFRDPQPGARWVPQGYLKVYGHADLPKQPLEEDWVGEPSPKVKCDSCELVMAGCLPRDIPVTESFPFRVQSSSSMVLPPPEPSWKDFSEPKFKLDGEEQKTGSGLDDPYGPLPQDILRFCLQMNCRIYFFSAKTLHIRSYLNNILHGYLNKPNLYRILQSLHFLLLLTVWI